MKRTDIGRRAMCDKSSNHVEFKEISTASFIKSLLPKANVLGKTNAFIIRKPKISANPTCELTSTYGHTESKDNWFDEPVTLFNTSGRILYSVCIEAASLQLDHIDYEHPKAAKYSYFFSLDGYVYPVCRRTEDCIELYKTIGPPIILDFTGLRIGTTTYYKPVHVSDDELYSVASGRLIDD